jgi:hypothetical protein
MIFELVACNLLRDMELLVAFKEGDSLFGGLIDMLFVGFATGPYGISEFFEPCDDILGDFEFEVGDIFVLDIFDGSFDKSAINTLGEHGTGFEDEAHLLFGKDLSGGEVLVKKKLPGKINFIVPVEHSGDFLRGQSLKLLLRNELKPPAQFEKLAVFRTLLPQLLDVPDEHCLVALRPYVVDLCLLELLHEQ